MNVIILKYGRLFHRTKNQNTHYGCFNLYCNGWVCVCGAFVMSGCFVNVYLYLFTVFCTVCTVFFVLFRLCLFILIVLSVLV